VPSRKQAAREAREKKKRAAKRASARNSNVGDRASEAAVVARDLARRARDTSMARVRNIGTQARERVTASLTSAIEPHLCFVVSPRRPIPPVIMSDSVRVATYNVHRWQGANGRTKPDVARAGFVISELDADVIALQEVLRPFDSEGEDSLGLLCDELDLHLAFAVTRRHRRGQLGNAILSRFPITAISVIDISHSRIERRGALAAQVGHAGASLGVVATHLSLVDRTRQRQVQTLLEHPQMNTGPTILMGDMNAWRKCKGSKQLEQNFNLHHNIDWPASFPSGRPMLALDRIYTRRAAVVDVRNHDTPAARKASDHLPIVADVVVEKPASEPSR
jgi:endonuclease/exonuclease/phosphatase family metal-dependent hydrolase